MDLVGRIIAHILSDSKRMRKWRTATKFLAMVVVFVTTYALILPAITIEIKIADEMPGIEVEELLEDEISVVDSQGAGVQSDELLIDEEDGNRIDNGSAADLIIEDAADDQYEGNQITDESFLPGSEEDLLQVEEDSLDEDGLSGVAIDDSAFLTENEFYLAGDLQAETAGLQVRLSFDETAKIPEGAMLRVNSYMPEEISEEMARRLWENSQEAGGPVFALRDGLSEGGIDSRWFLVELIGADGNRIEPQAVIDAEITFSPALQGQNRKLLYIEETGTAGMGTEAGAARIGESGDETAESDGINLEKIAEDAEIIEINKEQADLIFADEEDRQGITRVSFRTKTLGLFAALAEEEELMIEEEPEVDPEAEIQGQTEDAATVEVVAEEKTEAGTETQTEAETEAQSLEEAEVQTEIETETLAEAETEDEIQAENETEVGKQTAADAETETEVDTEADSETETQFEIEPETELESETEPETEKQSETEPETEMESETESETEKQSETELETEMLSEAEAETEMPSDLEQETTAESETGSLEKVRSLLKAGNFTLAGLSGANEEELLFGRLGKTNQASVQVCEAAQLLFNQTIVVIPDKGTYVTIIKAVDGMLGLSKWYQIRYTDGEGTEYTGYVRQEQIDLVETQQLQPAVCDLLTASLRCEAGVLPADAAMKAEIPALTQEEEAACREALLSELATLPGMPEYSTEKKQRIVEIRDFALFDLTIQSAKDGAVKPNGCVQVELMLQTPITLEENENLHLIHFTENGPEAVDADGKTEFIKNEEGNLTAVSFETDSFSPYAIVGTTIEKTVMASDGNNYRITATYGAETGIPEDAELEVFEILPDSDTASVYGISYEEYLAYTENALGIEEGSAGYIRLFDIKIVDQDDHSMKYQPADGTTVDVRIELADAETKSLSVVHFADGNMTGDVVNSAVELNETGQAVSFKANGFSVYSISEKGPIRTYSFYSPDASGNYSEYYFQTDTGERVYQQRIKTVDGVTEELVIPQLPSIPGSTTSTFAGWYVYDPATGTYADEPFDFENIPAVTAEEEVVLRARFADFAYVIFHDQYNGSTQTWPVAETRRGEKTDGVATIRIDDVTVTYDDSKTEENASPEMAFRGWSLTKVTPGESVDINGEPWQLVDSPVSITANTDLYPVFVPINWLTFSSGPTGSGATYIPPRYYYVDEGENDFPIPIRAGYTFDGWYTAENGGTKIVNANGSLAITGTVGDFSVVDGELRISDDATLYGHWTEADSKYTVVVWRQKVTDDPNLSDDAKKYDFAESFSLDAVTGSVVNVANTYKNFAGSGDYAGFHYGRCDNGKTVNGNGSTVLNVYYDRNVHTLTFRVDNTTRRSITGLYGSSIKEYFPIVGTNGFSYDGYVWTDTGRPKVYPFVLSTIETMPDSNVTFTGASRGTNKTIYYYVEVDNLEESDGTTFNGKYYILYKTVKHAYNFITYDEEYHPITGYIRNYSSANPEFYYSSTRGGYTADIGSGNNNYLYYDRDTFEITFTDSYTNQNVIVNGTEIEPASIKFNQRISDVVPTAPTSSREGYQFTGWYADSACSTRVYFTEEEYNNSTVANKVLYDRMPANNLQLFAGWETEWFLVELDPNGGVLTGNQSTWFWEPYNGDPIEEYTTTTRNFRESLEGTYYYAIQDRDYYGLTDEWASVEDDLSSRGAYYTTDVSDPAADLSKKYEYAENAYRYAGWYEVHEDGTETLYAFGQPVLHNTKLRLHWKELGTYYLRYDAGEGTLDNQDNNEDVFHTLDESDYTDHANMVVTRTANAPEGKSFVGWTIRGGDGTIYSPGQSFEFQSIYAFEESVDGIEKEYLILDAVYSTIGSAKIIYDANGGTVDSETVDYGGPTDPDAYKATSSDETTATISGLLNNSEVTLSTGNGFSLEGAELTGWNTEPDATGEHFNAGDNYYVDKEDPLTLYAEWRIKVYFDKNNENADWGGSWDAVDSEGNRIYTWDENRQQYYTYAFINGTVDKPAYIPVSSDTEEMFSYWSPVRYTDSGDVAYEYAFSTPVEGELTLYGFWENALQVPYHVVDASEATLTEDNSWKKTGQETFHVNTNTNIPLAIKTDTESYVDIPAGYDYAFACVSDSLENCSEETIITNIGYNTENRCVSVTYADGTVEDLPSDKEIYLVYFENPKTIPIDYKLVNTDESLEDVTIAGAVPTFATAGNYNMSAEVNAPLAWAEDTNIRYYSYAIGDVDAVDCSQVHVITSSSGSDASRPHLQIRNTWRGFQYSTDNGNTWTNYGYDPELYVLYYPSEPTLVTINENTIGTQVDQMEEFEYEIVITETRTERVETQTRTKEYHNWGRYWDRNWSAWSDSFTNENSTITEVSSYTQELSDGESETNTLFFSENIGNWTIPSDNDYVENGNTRTQTRTRRTITVTQTITVIQHPKNGFTTTNDNGDHEYTYTYTTTSTNEDQEVTYTNTRTKEDIELHIALAQNGGFIAHDEDLRTDDASIYTVSIPNGQTINLSESNPSDLFTGDASQYHFAGIIYGKDDGEGNITSYYTDINSVSFSKLQDSEYLGVYMNEDPSKLIEDGYAIYYVYYQMPKIVYMQEGANGVLTQIDPIERNGEAVSMNGGTVTQNTKLEVGTDTSFVIAQSTDGYRVPPDLDGHSALSLDYVKIGAGAAGVANTSALDIVSDEKSIQLKVIDSQIQWSLDGENWNAFSGDPVIYVIYKEKGYDLTITKTVSGHNTDGVFDVVISSPAITETSYSISGYEIEEGGETITVETVTAVPATADDPGTIFLNVRHGSEITISALQHGTYTVSEPNLAGYTMDSAKIGGYSHTVENDQFTFVLAANNTAAIINKPSTVPIKLLKVDQMNNPLEGATFSISGEDINQSGLVSTNRTIKVGEDDVTEALIYENDALPIGEYTLTETGAPAGYLALEGDVLIKAEFLESGIKVTASINETEIEYPKIVQNRDTGEWTILITNQSGAALPATGGPGTRLTYLFGIMLTGLASAGLVMKRRRRNAS